MSKFRALSVLGLVASTSAFAVTFSMTSRGGKAFTLEAEQEVVTEATEMFSLCGDGVDAVKKVKLWMPEHGHGSSAVKVGAVQDGCRQLTAVNFTMTGSWEVRVELTDGDSGKFDVDVE